MQIKSNKKLSFTRNHLWKLTPKKEDNDEIYRNWEFGKEVERNFQSIFKDNFPNIFLECKLMQ